MATSATAPTETSTWRNRITGSGEEAPDQLLANPANWRIHPKAQQDALAGALDEVGWVQQILVNRRTGFVVDGHARVALALSRGEPAVPVVYVDLDPREEALVLATLDPIGAMAGRDEEKLRALLVDVTVDNAGLLALLGDLSGTAPRSGLSDPDDAPAIPEEPTVKYGDLYLLGEHRLLCGDATDGVDVDRLMGGVHAAMMFTDPPWNVAIGQDSNPRHRQRPGLRNDDLSDDDFATFLGGFASLAVPLVEGDVYCILGAAAWPALDLALRGAGLHWSATIIWVKDAFVLGRSKYHRRYEPLWYGWRDRSSFAAAATSMTCARVAARPRRVAPSPGEVRRRRQT